MKKITVNTIIALALGSMCLSSCIGSFSLTNNVLNWNKRATDNKFINELIFIVISPAMQSAQQQTCLYSTLSSSGQATSDCQCWQDSECYWQGWQMYAIKTLKNGYEITDPAGEKSYFVFDKKNKSWSYSKDGDIRELFSFNEDGSIQACLPNGQKMNVEQNEIGLYQLRMAVNDGLYFACNK